MIVENCFRRVKEQSLDLPVIKGRRGVMIPFRIGERQGSCSTVIFDSGAVDLLITTRRLRVYENELPELTSHWVIPSRNGTLGDNFRAENPQDSFALRLSKQEEGVISVGKIDLQEFGWGFDNSLCKVLIIKGGLAEELGKSWFLMRTFSPLVVIPCLTPNQSPNLLLMSKDELQRWSTQRFLSDQYGLGICFLNHY